LSIYLKETLFRFSELSNESTTKLAEKIISLEYTLEEKERAISVLKQGIDHQRKLSANFSNRFENLDFL